jgi:hypothetical protein
MRQRKKLDQQAAMKRHLDWQAETMSSWQRFCTVVWPHFVTVTWPRWTKELARQFAEWMRRVEEMERRTAEAPEHAHD